MRARDERLPVRAVAEHAHSGAVEARVETVDLRHGVLSRRAAPRELVVARAGRGQVFGVVRLDGNAGRMPALHVRLHDGLEYTRITHQDMGKIYITLE